jgi:hypothetical protein
LNSLQLLDGSYTINRMSHSYEGGSIPRSSSSLNANGQSPSRPGSQLNLGPIPYSESPRITQGGPRVHDISYFNQDTKLYIDACPDSPAQYCIDDAKAGLYLNNIYAGDLGPSVYEGLYPATLHDQLVTSEVYSEPFIVPAPSHPNQIPHA